MICFVRFVWRNTKLGLNRKLASLIARFAMELDIQLVNLANFVSLMGVHGLSLQTHETFTMRRIDSDASNTQHPNPTLGR